MMLSPSQFRRCDKTRWSDQYGTSSLSQLVNFDQFEKNAARAGFVCSARPLKSRDCLPDSR